ncbi:metal ABC transporter permease [Candidatus Peregrinibacteria bacterium]|nr:MAG: metal ABC transporter permease [Candidatus Peregrinibacteria bacterium]
MSIFEYSFMVRALLAGSLIAVVAPLLGTFVVARNTSLIADTLAHAALAGVGIGVILGISPTWGAVVVALLAALGIEYLMKNHRFSADAVLALFLSGGLALAVALVRVKGAAINFENYLFGSLITVTAEEVWILLITSLAMIGIMVASWWSFLSLSFSEELTSTRGLKTKTLKNLLALLTGLMVSQSLKIVVGLLIGAMMVIPVLTAITLCQSARYSLLVSVIFALLSVWSGLILSYYINVPSGSAIVLMNIFWFAAALLVKGFGTFRHS